MSKDFDSGKGWSVLPPAEARIKQKIESIGTPLRDWDIQINYGVKTGFNEAFIISSEKRQQILERSPEADEIIRPILRGRDIKRYTASFQNLWIIFTRRGIDIERYPAVKEHLMEYYDQLKPRGQGDTIGRKPGAYKWFEIQDNVAYYEDFSRNKIIWIELTDSPNFYLDTDGYYVNNTVFALTGRRLYYLLAFLNSKVCEWYFTTIAATSGVGTRRWIKIYIDQIRIPNRIDVEIEARLSTLAIDIQNDKRRGTNTADKEQKVEAILHTLFGLTQQEVHVMEAALAVVS